MPIGKTELSESLADATGLSKSQSSDVISALTRLITEELINEDGKVTLPGFGTFEKSHRSERQGRNPQTGAAITIPASNSVRFKAGATLKKAVN